MEFIVESERPQKLRIQYASLLVISPDELVTTIGGLTARTSTDCVIRLELLFQEEPYFLIEAKFAQKNDVLKPTESKVHRKSIRIYAENFIDVSVDQLESLPPGLEGEAAEKALSKGRLWSLELMYSNHVDYHLNELPSYASDHSKQAAALFLGNLDESVTLYFRYDGDEHLSKIRFMKTLMAQQKSAIWFSEYFGKRSKQPVLQWGMEGFGPERDQPKKKTQRNFRDLNHLAVALGYGEMREASQGFDAAIECLQSNMTMSVVTASKHVTSHGLPMHYVGFVTIPEAQSVRQVLLVGITGTCVFEENPSVEYQPEGWSFEIKPPLPHVQAPGDLTILLTRPDDDDGVIPTAPFPSLDMMEQSSIPIHLFPKMTDVAAKRLVNVASRIREKPDDNIENVRRLQRTIEARDFHDTISHGLLNDLDEATFKKLTEHLRDTQKAAIEHVKETHNLYALIQGPPGSGKSFFAASLARLFAEANNGILICAPSNAAVEVNASMLEKQAPHLRPIRLHGIGEEVNMVLALYRNLHGSQATAEASAKKSNKKRNRKRNKNRNKSPSSEMNVVDQESVWVDVIGAAMRKDSKWVGMKNLRPHFQNLGLYVRALESMKILKNGELQRSKPHLGPNHEMQGFLDAFYDPETMNNTDPEGENKSLRAWTRDLFKATIMQAKIIITTCSNSATNLLRQQFSPSVVIVDEAAMAKELETLLPAYHNVSSMKLAVLIGDPKQLPPTVTPKHKTVNDERDGQLVNVFADQMEYSLMTRLYDNDYPTFMFDEQHRMAPGLSSCSNSLFYKNAVKDGPETSLAIRQGAQNAIKFLIDEYRLPTKVPHIFLSVPNSVCIRTKTKSRINLHNVVIDLNTIERIVGANLFKTSEISLCTPYKEQANRIRHAMYTASKTPFWTQPGRQIFDIAIKTTDSFQGGENRCIILDLVLAKSRLGGVGFVSHAGRLNVGVTRARDALFIVGDIDCLDEDNTMRTDQAVEKMATSDDEDTPTSWEGNLRKVIDFYKNQRAVTPSVTVESVAQKVYVDMQEVQSFQEEQERIRDKRNPRCRKCQQTGHRISDCPNQRVASPSTECRNCNGLGHLSANCPEPRRETRTCNYCNQPGHIKSQCPTRPLPTCHKCLEVGHNMAQCEGPDRRPCRRCNMVGHKERDCPRKKHLFTHPHIAANKKQRDESKLEMGSDDGEIVDAWASGNPEQPEVVVDQDADNEQAQAVTDQGNESGGYLPEVEQPASRW